MFKNKEGKVRSGWKIAAVTAVMFSLVMIFSIIIGIAVLFISISKGDIDLANFNMKSYQEILGNWETVLMFIQEIFIILVPLITWRFIMKQSLHKMGLISLQKGSKELITGLIVGILSITFVFITIVLLGHASVTSWKPHFSADTLVYLILFIMVGFAEEIYGRGFIMSVLRQTKSIPLIFIISSVIFAIMHSGNSGIGLIPYINLFLVGVLFAYMYMKSGNLWMCIGYHITWNYFQGNIYGFPVSGTNTNGLLTTIYERNTILNGGDFGPEGGLIVTFVILLGLFFVKIYYRNSSYYFLEKESAPNI
ncbi:MAG: family intrarane metalloprotease protein [Herbinix sp.]|jgi:membrane protease YdiL (CAAX protease family)|nr:family intrarane metalloprotease protein [Herbinix sp.]